MPQRSIRVQNKLAAIEVAATEAGSDAPAAPEAEAAAGPTAPPPADQLLAAIVEKFPGCGWAVSHGQPVAFVPRADLVELGEWLRDEEGFSMCVDVTAVDYLDQWDRPMGTWEGDRPRFEVVVNLLDMGEATPPHLLPEGTDPLGRPPRRVRLRVPVAEGDLRCPSLAFVWALADSGEREVYDMFGIAFDGHPDLSRILMPDDWEGHPLRKDYAIGRIPVVFQGDSERQPTPVTFRRSSDGPSTRFKGGVGTAPPESNEEAPR